ncbi:FAD/NAD(P)-binding protein [Patescibacteria group bacterium]|nr:FAD/NAD(P)-binding protein [Patescibacteria group bacterium]
MTNIYQPKEAIISEIKRLTANTKHFTLRFSNSRDRENFNFDFGQFIMLSVLGFGEIPLGVSSSPDCKENFEIGVRKSGTVTSGLFKLKLGDKVGLRGPFGKGIKPNDLKYKSIALIAGGVGLVPLRSLIQYVSWHRKDFGRVSLIYGAKSRFELLYKDEHKNWQKTIDTFFTVDEDIGDWTGQVGLVTKICNPENLKYEDSIAIVCGPPVMYKSVAEKLKGLGFQDKDIYLLLERQMKCGVGKCQHCVCDGKYVCQDGPVFTYEEAKEIKGMV